MRVHVLTMLHAEDRRPDGTMNIVSQDFKRSSYKLRQNIRKLCRGSGIVAELWRIGKNLRSSDEGFSRRSKQQEQEHGYEEVKGSKVNFR